MPDIGDIVDAIKSAAVSAVEEGQPSKFVFGTVVYTNPLRIKVSDKLILTSEFLTLTRNVTKFKTTCKIGTGTTQTITIDNSLQFQDKVVLIKNQSATGYLVLDRVVRA